MQNPEWLFCLLANANFQKKKKKKKKTTMMHNLSFVSEEYTTASISATVFFTLVPGINMLVQ